MAGRCYRIPLSVGILLWLALVAGAAVHGEAPALVVENARIIVGDGTVVDNGSVVIENERVEKNHQRRGCCATSAPARCLGKNGAAGFD